MEIFKKSLSISLPIYMITTIVSFIITLFSIKPVENVTKTTLTGIEIKNTFENNVAQTFFSINYMAIISFVITFGITYILCKIFYSAKK